MRCRGDREAVSERPKTYVYIAGPYGDKDPYCVIDERINMSRKAAADLALNGIPYYSPHLNCAHFEAIVPEAPVAFWVAMGMVFVDQAWALLLLPEWHASKGTLAERDRAIALGMGQYEYAHDCDFTKLVEAWESR